MDRLDFYYRQIVTEGELDDAFEKAEVADRAMMLDLGWIGRTSGLTASEASVPDLTVDIAAGSAYDNSGQRIGVDSVQNVDVSVDDDSISTAVVGASNTKIVSVFIEFDRALSDSRLDGNGESVSFLRDESFNFVVRQGSESAGTPTPPALESGKILLADITLSFGQTAIVDANISFARTETLFEIAAGTSIAAIATNTAEEAVNALHAIVDGIVTTGASSFLYAGGGNWADGTTNPAATIEAQLDKIISDLSGNGGAAKIGIGAISDNEVTVTAGTLTAAITEILGQVRGYINVKVFGATGDGSTDDSTAIQDALDAAAAAGYLTVYFPRGTYQCNNLVWPAGINMLGAEGGVTLRNNHASNPTITSSVSGATSVPDKFARGIRFSFQITNSSGILVRISNNVYVEFDDCQFDGVFGNASAPTGNIHLGSAGHVTRITCKTCYFANYNNTYDLIIGTADGTTYVNLINGCHVFSYATARVAAYGLVEANYIKSIGTHWDMSTAVATTYFYIFDSTAAGSIVVEGNTFQALAGGTLWLFSIVSGIEVREHGNVYPSDSVLINSLPAVGSELASRQKRTQEIVQSGTATINLDPNEYETFEISISDTSAFALTVDDGNKGDEFHLVIHNTSGGNSGTITYTASDFSGTTIASAGILPPTFVANDRTFSLRFKWITCHDGNRWYPIGSSIHSN